MAFFWNVLQRVHSVCSSSVYLASNVIKRVIDQEPISDPEDRQTQTVFVYYVHWTVLIKSVLNVLLCLPCRPPPCAPPEFPFKWHRRALGFRTSQGLVCCLPPSQDEYKEECCAIGLWWLFFLSHARIKETSLTFNYSLQCFLSGNHSLFVCRSRLWCGTCFDRCHSQLEQRNYFESILGYTHIMKVLLHVLI